MINCIVVTFTTFQVCAKKLFLKQWLSLFNLLLSLELKQMRPIFPSHFRSISKLKWPKSPEDVLSLHLTKRKVDNLLKRNLHYTLLSSFSWKVFTDMLRKFAVGVKWKLFQTWVTNYLRKIIFDGLSFARLVSCFAQDPANVVKEGNSKGHVERLYCGHVFHLKCLIKYMKTPPFQGKLTNFNVRCLF